MENSTPSSDEKQTAKPAYIVRATEGPYFSLRRKTAQERTLSYEARGMLVYLLSKPIDWKVQLADLEQGCGRDKVRKILAELIKHGYIVRSKRRRTGEDHHYLPTEYRVREEPYTENPYTDSPYTEKPTGTDERAVQSTETQSRDSTAHAVAPDDPITDYESEMLVPHTTNGKPVEPLPPSKPSKGKKKVVPAPAPKEAKPPQPNVAIIDAWLEPQAKPAGNPYGRYGIAAKALVADGYTPEQVKAYTIALMRDNFWKEKLIPLEYVATNIASWLKAKKGSENVKPTQTAKPIPAFPWEESTEPTKQNV